MSERLHQPERRGPNAAQEIALREACDRYGVQYAAENYYVYPEDSPIMPLWAEGWLGGAQHANPDYVRPQEPALTPTLCVGVDPEGRIHS